MTPAHEKAAAVAVGIASGLSWVAGAVLAGLQTFGAILGILSVMLALLGGFFGLYMRKLIRDREEEREGKLDERFDHLREEFRRLDAIISKALLEHSQLADQVANLKENAGNDLRRHSEELRLVNDRLQRGATTIARLETAVSSLARGRVTFGVNRNGNDGS